MKSFFYNIIEKEKREIDSKEKALQIARHAGEKKGFDIVLVEVGEISVYADYFLIVTGNSERHLRTIGEHILYSLKKGGESPLGVEGFSNTGWILIDYNDVIVHIFLESHREFYDLEGLWADAPQERIPRTEEPPLGFGKGEGASPPPHDPG